MVLGQTLQQTNLATKTVRSLARVVREEIFPPMRIDEFDRLYNEEKIKMSRSRRKGVPTHGVLRVSRTF